MLTLEMAERISGPPRSIVKLNGQSDVTEGIKGLNVNEGFRFDTGSDTDEHYRLMRNMISRLQTIKKTMPKSQFVTRTHKTRDKYFLEVTRVA